MGGANVGQIRDLGGQSKENQMLWTSQFNFKTSKKRLFHTSLLTNHLWHVEHVDPANRDRLPDWWWRATWWRFQTNNLAAALESWFVINKPSPGVGVIPDRPNTSWCERAKGAVKALHLFNSHPEVQSVVKHHQTSEQKKRRGSRRWCHVPLERSIFTATQASSSALLGFRHPALSFRSVRQKQRFCFSESKSGASRHIQNFCFQLNGSFNLHACFIGERRGGMEVWQKGVCDPTPPLRSKPLLSDLQRSGEASLF